MPAAVIVAHDQPTHLHRLIAALDPLPVFLHIDAGAPRDLWREMTAGLPERVRLLPRVQVSWAGFGVLQAELLGYRAALRTGAEHIIVCTGSDYPLVSTDRIVRTLRDRRGFSFGYMQALPIAEWGPTRGYDRFVVPNWPVRRHRVVAPIPRRRPRGLALAGGSQCKILARRHAELVIDLLDRHPRLLRYFRRCWVPDEVAIPSMLHSPALGGRWPAESVPGHPWWMDWGEAEGRTRVRSPDWLGIADFERLAAAVAAGPHVMFARKIGDDAGDLVRRIDAELRAGVAGVSG
nr:beta-1,6-N-acetylglucosaminyltransferase [Naumannella cuiyingiana]